MPLKKLLHSPLNLTVLKKLDFGKRNSTPGAAPGIENIEGINKAPQVGDVKIRCIDYSENHTSETEYNDIDAFLASERPAEATYRWINVDGIHPYVINRVKENFDLHTLAAEDALNLSQRPKIEDYDNSLFIVTRMLMMRRDSLGNEQVSIFHKGDILITIQEEKGDVWDNVRLRMKKPNSRFSKFGNDYLLYALIDAVIDHIYPLLENYSDLLSELETQAFENPTPELQRHIHRIKRELLLYRRVVGPMREVVNHLYRDEDDQLKTEVKHYFRDVYDHTMQLIEVVDTYREMTSSLNEFYMSSISNRMNEIMKVLTIMASIFIPITFVAGVYGMNFEHIPELRWNYAYPTFWALCLSISGGLIFYFWKKGWLRF